MHELCYPVPPESEGKTLRAVALGVLGVSRGQLSRLKFQDGIWVNGRRERTDRRLAAGDRLCLRFREPSLPLPKAGTAELRVLFEDEDLLVVDKPAPLSSISSARKGGETLQNRVYSHLGCPQDFVYRPVSRLDSGTSGLMVVAKHAYAQHRMQLLLHTDAFVREYLAVVTRAPLPAEGTIRLEILGGGGSKRRAGPGGRAAVTHYSCLRTAPRGTLLSLRLETGRTHQIRVHLSAIGCPVAGDPLYGEPDARLPGRFALHSCSVRFTQPLSGLQVQCVSPLPEELEHMLY